LIHQRRVLGIEVVAVREAPAFLEEMALEGASRVMLMVPMVSVPTMQERVARAR
jgi:hypothetical protein